jgi:uracil-DNA glycosylase
VGEGHEPPAGPGSAVAELSRVAEEASTCTRCRLAGTRTNVVFGTGSPTADLMFVGEGPGEQEDRQGLPFVGRSGQLLDRLVLEEMGLTRDSVYIANTIKCRPPGNRDPLPEELEACWPYLETQLELINPKVVVTLGNFATKRLLGATEGISRLRGRIYPYRSGYLVPTFHPSAALRGGGQVVAQMRADLVRAKEALHLARPPRVQALQAQAPQVQALSLVQGPTGAEQRPASSTALAGEHGGRGAEPLL